MDPTFCIKQSSGGELEFCYDLVAKVRVIQPCYFTGYLAQAPLQDGATIVGNSLHPDAH
jgi:hypothetical protein